MSGVINSSYQSIMWDVICSHLSVGKWECMFCGDMKGPKFVWVYNTGKGGGRGTGRCPPDLFSCKCNCKFVDTSKIVCMGTESQGFNPFTKSANENLLKNLYYWYLVKTTSNLCPSTLDWETKRVWLRGMLILQPEWVF